ncbi:MAG: hypothetical protein EA400_04450 [Chromatiaceae bacterium]|nr:MAG: hypothetical protein EA400_04450 [Chromatiaceae bacterium]
MRHPLLTLPWRAVPRACRDAAAQIAALPPYQIALWPDGWELEAGAVLVGETHAMAEARRWYQSRDRRLGTQGTTHANRRGATPAASGMAGPAPGLDHIMRLHGVFVPRAVVALAGQRFPSEATASVALQLIAGDWIASQRRVLLTAPQSALALRERAWCGSRHRQLATADQVAALIEELLADCVQEGLATPAACAVRVRADAGFELRTWRCRISADLDHAGCVRLQASLALALIPWNRALIRDGAPTLLISVQVVPAAVTGRVVAGLDPG